MSDIKHDEECVVRTIKYEKFFEEHPDYCKMCDGAGGFSYISSIYGFPPNYEPCEECVSQGKCPICEFNIVFEEHDLCDYGFCGACGWDECGIIQGYKTATIAPDTECWCGIDD